MNRLTNGKNRNRKRNSKSRVNQNVDTIVRNRNVNKKNSNKKRYNSRKPSVGLRLRKNAAVLMLILCVIVILFMNRNDISAYFTSLKQVSNVFSIDAYYDITFYSNDGSGQTETQTISYNVPTQLIDNPFNYDGYQFKEWNTEADGSGSSYADKEEVNNLGDIELYAQWEEGQYTITFDKNSESATGVMAEQIIPYNVETELSANEFALEGFLFAGWNTKSDGTGTKYKNKQAVTNLGNITLYAQWERSVKYAVSIYGINQDVGEDGNPLGLTFGPATGESFKSKYITHRYEETSIGSGVYNVIIVNHTINEDGSETITEEELKNSEGNTVTRTAEEKNKYDKNLHEMTWEEIAKVSDKTEFLDCMLCGDTKSVKLILNDTVASGIVYEQPGDGAGTILDSIAEYYRIWNPDRAQNRAATLGGSSGNVAQNDGAYSSSHMRASLIGENSKTDVRYAGNVNLSESNSIYSCIEDDLRNVITAKVVKYATGPSRTEYYLNDDIVDKIWLFSQREFSGTASSCGVLTEGIGTEGNAYDRFMNPDSHYYLSSFNNEAHELQRAAYNENEVGYNTWFRSVNLWGGSGVYITTKFVGLSNSHSPNMHHAIAFGFCIDKGPVSYTVRFDPNGGTGSMEDQIMKSNEKAALRENAFTYEERAFIGWNTKADGSGISYADKEEVSNLASTEGAIVTLYAQWRRTGDPKKGDYVAYHPVASEIDSSYTDFQPGQVGYTASDHTYHITDNYLGLSSQDTFEHSNSFIQENLRWRVWDIDSQTVRLVPEGTTSQKLGIKNTVGFNNGLFLMNDICSKLYAGEVDGITAKSLTYKDIEEKAILNYAATHSNSSGYVNNAGKPIWSEANIRTIFGLENTYGQGYILERTNSTTRRFLPTIFANETFNKTTTDTTSTIYLQILDMENDYANGSAIDPPTSASYWQGPDSASPGTSRPMSFKQTYYTVDENPASYLDSIDRSLVFTGNNYWVASRSLRYTNSSSPYFQFYVRMVSNRNTLTQYVLAATNNQTGVTGSTIGSDGYGLRLRPIVTIDRSKFDFEDGGTEWNLVSH